MNNREDDYPQIRDEEVQDDIEFRRFMRGIIPQLLPRAERDLAAMKKSRLPVSELLRILLEGWDVIELIWRASSPGRQQRDFEERLAPFWREIRPLMKHTHEMAEAELERRYERRARAN
jgi:hypothetical protein